MRHALHHRHPAWLIAVARAMIAMLALLATACGAEPSHAPGTLVNAEAVVIAGRESAWGEAPEASPNAIPDPSWTETTSSSWIGVVVAASSVELAAGIAGPLARVLVRPGDAVAAGDIVAEVDALLLRPDQRRAEAALAGAEAEQRRVATASRQASARHARRAAAPEVVSREELAAAAIEAESTAAEEQAAVARVAERRAEVEQLRRELASAVVRAPFDGLVAQRLLDPGATVSAGTPIVRVVSSDGGLVRFAVPVEALQTLAVGDRVQVRLNTTGVTARVVHIAPEVDVAANRVFVDATIVTDEAGPSASTFTRAGMGVRVQPMGKG